MENLSQTSASVYEALERFRKKRTNLINQAHVEWSRELFVYKNPAIVAGLKRA